MLMTFLACRLRRRLLRRKIHWPPRTKNWRSCPDFQSSTSNTAEAPAGHTRLENPMGERRLCLGRAPHPPPETMPASTPARSPVGITSHAHGPAATRRIPYGRPETQAPCGAPRYILLLHV